MNYTVASFLMLASLLALGTTGLGALILLFKKKWRVAAVWAGLCFLSLVGLIVVAINAPVATSTVAQATASPEPTDSSNPTDTRPPAAPRPTSPPKRKPAKVASSSVRAPKPDNGLNDPSLNMSIRRLMNEYVTLRSRVSDIIDDAASGDDVLSHGGARWYSDEREFQSEIHDLSAPNRQYETVAAGLTQVETFLYSAGVNTIGSCDPANGKRELTVSDYYFHAVQKWMASGAPDADDVSDPPYVADSDHHC